MVTCWLFFDTISLMLNVKQESCEYQNCKPFGLTRRRNRTQDLPTL